MLTNVLTFQEVKSNPDMHQCRKTVFEIVNVTGEQACLSFNAEVSPNQEGQIKASVACGKIFANIGLHEIVLALGLDALLNTNPIQVEEQIFVPNLTYLDNSRLEDSQQRQALSLTLTVDALEASVSSWHQMAENASLITKFERNA